MSARPSVRPSVSPSDVRLSVRLSVRMELFGSRWTDFHDIQYLSIFRKTVKEIQVSFKSDKKTGTLHADQYTFFIPSLSILLRMKNVSDKSCRGNQNTNFVINNFFRKSCHL